MKKTGIILYFVLTVGFAGAQRHSIVISEIMADPSPPAGLPEYEWIELYNRTDQPVDIGGWRIADKRSRSGPIPPYILQPGACILVAGSTATTHLSAHAPCLPVTSWPALDNDGDDVVLFNNEDKVIHTVAYDISWYENTVKREGGWSLEMTDSRYSCLGRENWSASGDPRGASPGMAPSGHLSPGRFPVLRPLRAHPVQTDMVQLWFSHEPDSAAASQPSSYHVQGGPGIVRAELLPPYFDNVTLQLSSPLSEGQVIRIAPENIRDCAGNSILTDTLSVAIPSRVAAGDIILNEILFAPPADGADYAEIYNRSNKVIDLAELHIASRHNNGALQSLQALSPFPELLFPQQYRVFCTDTAWMAAYYPVADRKAMRQLPSLPSFPNREGRVVLLNEQEIVLDELHYHENWHFPLLPQKQGVALERVNPAAQTQSAHSWHSASSASRYGTPGAFNSQQASSITQHEQPFILHPKRISPDNDGFEDRLQIQYAMPEAGRMASILVYNAAGTAVRTITRNALLGTSGAFTWDGLDDQQRPLKPGIYIVWAEWFDLNGKRKTMKEGIVLATR